jgi:NADPH:quinone reductase-like Zn-dependent oxidoreductase
VVDVAFGANLPLVEAVLAVDGVVAAYGSDRVPEPAFPFYSLMRRGATIRLVSVFALPADALERAAADMTALLADGALEHRVAGRYPLEQVAAHVAVERGTAVGKVIVTP